MRFASLKTIQLEDNKKREDQTQLEQLFPSPYKSLSTSCFTNAKQSWRMIHYLHLINIRQIFQQKSLQPQCQNVHHHPLQVVTVSVETKLFLLSIERNKKLISLRNLSHRTRYYYIILK